MDKSLDDIISANKSKFSLRRGGGKPRGAKRGGSGGARNTRGAAGGRGRGRGFTSPRGGVQKRRSGGGNSYSRVRITCSIE